MLNELVLYAQNEPKLPADRQTTWDLMGRAKLVMDKGLQLRSLEIQTIFRDYEKMDAVKLAEALAMYNKKYKEMVAFRKGYTKYLDMAIDQCMILEKSYEPATNETYKKVAAFELSEREKANKKVLEQSAKNNEIAAFNAHVKNEYYRLAAGYSAGLNKIIHDAHVMCLTQKTPVDNVHVAISAAKSAMLLEKPGLMQKFNRTHITDPEAQALFAACHKPDWAGIFKEASEALTEKFSMYAHDLAAADVVVQQATIDFNAQAVQASNELAQVQAATVLTESAFVLTATPEGLKPITEVSKIAIVDDSQAWVVAIMAAFMGNFQKCFPTLRVKKYSQITIQQMAAALDAAGIKVADVKYSDIKK